MATLPLKIEIRAIDRMSATLSRVSGRLRAFGGRLRGLGRSLSLNLSLPVAFAGAAIIKTAADFQLGMNRVRATLRLNKESLAFKRLNEQAKELGRTTQFTASQVAEAQLQLARGGLSPKEILKAVPEALNLASAGVIQLGDSANIVVKAMRGFGKNENQIKEITDKLVFTANNAATTIEELRDAFKESAPVMKENNITMSETLAILGVLANRGKEGARAGTAMKLFALRIQQAGKAGSDANKTFARLSERAPVLLAKSRVLDSTGRVRSLIDVLKGLEKAKASIPDLVSIFGQRAGPVIAGILNKGAIKSIEKLKTRLDGPGAIGEAARVAKANMEGAAGAILEFKSAMEGLFIAIAASGVLKEFTRITQKLTKFIQDLAETNPAILRTISFIVAAVGLLGPVIIAIGLLVGAVGTIMGAIAGIGALLLKVILNPIGFIITRIAILVGAIAASVKSWEDFTIKLGRFWSRASKIIRDSLASTFPSLLRFFNIIDPLIKNFISDMRLWEVTWKDIAAIPELATRAIKKTWTRFSSTMVFIWDIASGKIIDIFGRIADEAGIQIGKIDQALGGMIDFASEIISEWKKIEIPWEQIWRGIKQSVIPVIDFLGDVVVGLSKVVIKAWMIVQPTLSRIWEVIGRTVGNVIEKIGTLWEDNREQIMSGFEEGKKAIGKAADFLSGKFSEAFEEIGEEGKIIWKELKGLGLDFVDALLEGFRVFNRFIKNNFDDIRLVFKAFVRVAGPLLAGMLVGFVVSITVALKALVLFVKGVRFSIQVFREIFNSALGPAIRIFVSFWIEAFAFVISAIAEFIRFFQGVPNKIDDSLDKIGNFFVEIFDKISGAFGEFLKEFPLLGIIFDALLDKFEKIVAPIFLIEQAAIKLFRSLIPGFDDIVKKIEDVSSEWEGFSDVVRSALTAVKLILFGVGGQIKKKIGEIFDSIRDTDLGKISGFLMDFASSIRSIFTGPSGELFEEIRGLESEAIGLREEWQRTEGAWEKIWFGMSNFTGVAIVGKIIPLLGELKDNFTTIPEEFGSFSGKMINRLLKTFRKFKKFFGLAFDPIEKKIKSLMITFLKLLGVISPAFANQLRESINFGPDRLFQSGENSRTGISGATRGAARGGVGGFLGGIGKLGGNQNRANVLNAIKAQSGFSPSQVQVGADKQAELFIKILSESKGVRVDVGNKGIFKEIKTNTGINLFGGQ